MGKASELKGHNLCLIIGERCSDFCPQQIYIRFIQYGNFGASGEQRGSLVCLVFVNQGRVVANFKGIFL